MKLAVAFTVFSIFFAIGGVIGHRGYKHMVHDAAFCGYCHAHDYANNAWYEGAHYKSTTCHDCHHQSLYDNAKSGVLTAVHFGKKGEKLHNIPKVEDKHCEKCHLPVQHGVLLDILGPLRSYNINKIIKISETKGHKTHLNAQSRNPGDRIGWNSAVKTEQAKSKHHEDERVINCRDCHGNKDNRAHQFNASPANCSACHKSVHLSKTVNEHLNQNCLLCHFKDFLVVEKQNPYNY